MSDAIKCGKCSYVYWVNTWKNWGTCPKCHTNMDHWEGEIQPELWNSDEVFTYADDLIVQKAKEAIERNENGKY